MSETMTTKARARNKAARYRTFTRSGLAAGEIDREERVIRGYAVITGGEALGHRMWIDDEALDQVVEAGNAAPRGVKSRFTHPDMCSDGLGTYLGRARGFRRDGDVVRADLHLSEAAKNSPQMDNDPTAYVMDLAAEDPEAFATSIVYYHDIPAEDIFIAEHEDEDGNFISPDPKNTKNYYHMRIAKLEASDLVDEPAANPGGFFSMGDEAPARAEAALDYVLGLSDEAPMPGTFGRMEPERVRDFVQGYMARRNLSVTSPETEEVKMFGKSRKPDEQTDPVAEAKEDAKNEVERFGLLREAFPDDLTFAADAFKAGWDVTEAKAEYVETLRSRLAEAAEREKALRAENEGIRAELLKGAKPLEHAPEPQAQPDPVAAAQALQKERGGSEKMSFEDAYREVLAGQEAAD